MVTPVSPILNFQPFAGHKHHLVYDAAGKITDQYYTNFDTPDGGFAWHVKYAYDGDRITGVHEEYSTWDAAWNVL